MDPRLDHYAVVDVGQLAHADGGTQSAAGTTTTTAITTETTAATVLVDEHYYYHEREHDATMAHYTAQSSQYEVPWGLLSGIVKLVRRYPLRPALRQRTVMFHI